MDFNVYENNSKNILRPTNIENGETELKMIFEKHQYNDELIINNSLSDVRLNQVTAMINKNQPPLMGQLNDGTWINYNLIPFLKDNNSTEPLQYGYCVLGLITIFLEEN